MNLFEDTSQHQYLRKKLVHEIEEKGITDPRVMEAIFSIPRHLYMKPEDEEKAYMDKAFPIGEGQTISQPYTVAYQTQLLDVRPNDRILEIGTGSAYQATVLSYLGAEVFTIERQQKLYERNLRFEYLKQHPNIHLFYGDGYEGLPAYAPFHKILLTAAAPHIPDSLINQLADGGMLVAPVGSGRVQRMIRLVKHNEHDIEEEQFADFSFVPMLKGRQE